MKYGIFIIIHNFVLIAKIFLKIDIVKQIKNDLKDIQYYYANKEAFDIGAKEIGSNYVITLAEKYNKIIRNAPPKLYDLYVRMYLMNKAQETVGIETNFSWQTIALNCKKLMSFLVEELTKQENINA